MRKCFIMNKREYEAFLNVYMMSQGVLGCKYLFQGAFCADNCYNFIPHARVHVYGDTYQLK